MLSVLSSPQLPASPPAPPPGAALQQQAAALLPLVRAVVASVLGESRDHPDVQDAAHEVLRRALEGQERLLEPGALRPWVLGIARHVAIDVRRQRRRLEPARGRFADCDGAPAEDEPSPLDLLTDPGPGPEEQVDRAQRQFLVHKALQQLVPEQRQALLLFHTQGLGYQQIAEQLGVPLGTVATWISRGRKTIAQALAMQARTV